MTKIIGGTVLDTNLAPIASCPIEIELIQAQGFVVIGKYSLTPKMSVQTSAAGTWTATVVENDSITPSGTLYRITEKIPSAHGGSKNYIIQVLTSLGGGTNQILDLIVPSLSSVGSINTYLTKAYADATYSTVGTSVGPPGPTGPAGGSGAAGYIGVANRAALDALTPVSNLLVIQTDRMIAWIWNGTKYVPFNDPVFTGSGQRDANFLAPSIGDSYYQDVNTIAEGPFYRNHAGQWRMPWNMPWGLITKEIYTASSAAVSTPEVDVQISGVTVDISFTWIPNRNILVEFNGLTASTVTNDIFIWKMCDPSNTQLQQDTLMYNGGNVTQRTIIPYYVVGTGATQTFKLREVRNSGTGTGALIAGATFPSYFTATDVGPSGVPA
jgi:hypothetical protein